MKVEIIQEYEVATNYLDIFEKRINDFLKKIPEEKVVDIKYTVDINTATERKFTRYTAMIIYKD